MASELMDLDGLGEFGRDSILETTLAVGAGGLVGGAGALLVDKGVSYIPWVGEKMWARSLATALVAVGGGWALGRYVHPLVGAGFGVGVASGLIARLGVKFVPGLAGADLAGLGDLDDDDDLSGLGAGDDDLDLLDDGVGNISSDIRPAGAMSGVASTIRSRNVASGIS